MILDEATFFEIGKGYGRSQITGLARMNGQPVGVWANDGKHLAGAMTANGAQKVRRFIELCETFHLPILSFVDCFLSKLQTVLISSISTRKV